MNTKFVNVGSGDVRIGKVEVLNLTAFSLPPTPLPPGSPLSDGIDAQLAIGVHHDVAIGIERPIGFDQRSQLHAVVGRVRCRTAALLDDLVVMHPNEPPTAGT